MSDKPKCERAAFSKIIETIFTSDSIRIVGNMTLTPDKCGVEIVETLNAGERTDLAARASFEARGDNPASSSPAPSAAQDELANERERAERAESERDALREDAERYRWLRGNWFALGTAADRLTPPGCHYSAIARAGDVETLDAAIDAARGK